MPIAANSIPTPSNGDYKSTQTLDTTESKEPAMSRVHWLVMPHAEIDQMYEITYCIRDAGCPAEMSLFTAYLSYRAL